MNRRTTTNRKSSLAVEITLGLKNRTDFDAGDIRGVRLHYGKLYRVFIGNKVIAEWHDNGTRWVHEDECFQTIIVRAMWEM